MTDITISDLSTLAPELFLAVSGLILLLIGAFRGHSITQALGVGVAVVCAIAGVMVGGHFLSGSTQSFGGMVIVDDFGRVMKMMIMAGLAVSVLLSLRWMKQENMVRFEYPLLALFAGIGMMMMVSAHDFLTLYVALELQSLCLYVLAAIRRDTVASSEAGIKYFILGALSSGLLLFGISLIYGFAGTTSFGPIGQTLTAAIAAGPASMPVIGVVVGLVFVLAGVAFKISAVPFHMWTPDVYEGAPTPVTALFALVPKVAAIAMLIRILEGPFAPVVVQWSQIVTFMAVASMIWGAFAALGQNNIKRLLAYSSISNMGYALIGLLANTGNGIGAVIFYLIVYMVMTAGTFAIVMCLRRDNQAVENIPDLAGLSKTRPGLAYAMAALMFSMSGIPPLAGFFSKLFLFQAAVESGLYVVAVIGVVSSVVASYYYLRIIKVMFFDAPVGAALDPNPSFTRKAVTALSIAFILLLTFLPAPVLDTARIAAASLFE